MSEDILHRETFATSRLLDFCNAKQLTVETGHSPEDWPIVVAKETIDNSIDAAEEHGVAPEIDIQVSTERSGGPGEIVIADNGPGIPPKVVEGILDYTVRVSSREPYCSPSRGQQGNFLKTLVAMPFALDGKQGITVIAAQGVAHIVTFRVDHLRQEPVLDHDCVPFSTKGTWISLKWPNSALLNPGRCGIAFFTNCRRFRLAQPAPAHSGQVERRRPRRPRAVKPGVEKVAAIRSDLGALV